MKILTLTLNVGYDKIHLETDYIVSFREYDSSTPRYTEIIMITGDKYKVKETFAEIESILRKTGKLL